MSNKGAALAPSKAAGVNSRSTYGRSNATNTAAGGANKSHGREESVYWSFTSGEV